MQSEFERMEPVFFPHRRVYDRFLVDGAGEIALDGAARFPVVVRDVSAKGAKIVSSRSFIEKEKVMIRLELPLKEPVVRQATIIRCRKVAQELYEVGLDFSSGDSVSLT